MRFRVLAVLTSLLLATAIVGCSPRGGNPGGGGGDDDDDDVGGDADADGDSDSDGDADGDSDSDSDGDADNAGPERCDDQLDNDRDGLVDEDCPCELGTNQACYTGPAATRGLGVCSDGEQACGGQPEFPSWGSCAGDAVPGDEVCEDGIDNDCDGGIDEGCGEPDCEVPEFTEEQDCSDGEDEDCDGLPDCEDPDCSDECGDECAAQENDCEDGLDDDCNGLTDCVDPACNCGDGEVCDGRDNNGDGRIDEGRACGDAGDGNGACPPGAFRICDVYCGVHQLCDDEGMWGPCIVDNSCEQVPECDQHEDCPRGEYCDYGACSPGTLDPFGGACENDGDCDGGFGGFGDYTCQVDQGVCISDCYHHDDCGAGFVCDLGMCVDDPYVPGQC
ncbi:MAG: hypothetical protein HYY06_11370 [Deltaproteobacteria bacterium]|nr:hypothetical protein [Deltaproteobacteria bacterium]